MKKALLIVVIFLSLFSCSKAEINVNSSRLDGDWFMQEYSFYDILSPNLSEDYIIWSFDTQNNNLKVVNYFYDEEPYGLAPGEYSFSYTENEIFISVEDSTIRYDYGFNNNKLVLTDDQQQLDGGVLIYLTKNNNNCVIDPLADLAWLHEIKTILEISMNAYGSQIVQYNYNGECVYLVNDCFNCSDNLIQVYNVSGEVICEFGGVESVNTCPIFYETTTDMHYLFNNVSQSCDQDTTISEVLYLEESEEPTIISMEIINHCLHINYSDSGCDGNTWTLNLIDSDEVSSTEPPQRFLKLSITNEELCSTVITKETSFNIENLQVNGNQVLLKIADSQVLYEY